MRRWRVTDREGLFSHRLLEVERQSVEDGAERREVLVLDSAPWINVIPLLPDGNVVLVRQWRHGVSAPTLEIPGGMVDAGEDPAAAAARELREETGYAAAEWRLLGEIHPNPAIFANRVTTYLATDLARQNAGGGVDGEEIEVVTAPLERIPELVARREITHALVIAAFYLLSVNGYGTGGSEER